MSAYSSTKDWTDPKELELVEQWRAENGETEANPTETEQSRRQR